jgi:integration host factor subunit alpha
MNGVEGDTMAGKTLTRADLSEAVHREVGLSRTESAELVKAIIDTVAESVVSGDRVKLSSFGTFMVRDKGGRVGRNPKTGQEVPITPRRVLVFRPSQVMKSRINSSGGDEAQV